MDIAGGIENRIDDGYDADEGVDAADARNFEIGTDERRMHVRAYNHWVSLLNGRAYPSIEDLDPGSIADFGANSVLLDFTNGIEDPTIQFLGRSLREECDVDAGITRIAQVPSRSLLSRLTDHYLQIIANRAPIGFEAEFVSQRGHNTMYRGILMPFSSDEDTIDYIFGVINWKELIDPALQAQLHAEIDAARRVPARAPLAAPVWADGPSSGFGAGEPEDARPVAEPEVRDRDDAPLADRLSLARESAEAVRVADTRSRAALYRALGRAYDFALAIDGDLDGYRELLLDAGLKEQARAPMTPVAKLVFGGDYDKARLTEFASVLAFAKRKEVPQGGLHVLLDAFDGGMKGIVKAERNSRRGARAANPLERAQHSLRSAPVLAHVPIGADGDEFVVLLARAAQDGTLDVVARVDGGDALTAQVVRRATGA